jgi:hypothetical protein
MSKGDKCTKGLKNGDKNDSYSVEILRAFPTSSKKLIPLGLCYGQFKQTKERKVVLHFKVMSGQIHILPY